MGNVLVPFSPKPDELLFFSESQAVRYARNAGFTVINELAHGPTATRGDMPDIKFILLQDKDKPDRVYWVRL